MRKVYLGTQEISDKLRLGSERVEFGLKYILDIDYLIVAGGGAGGGDNGGGGGGGGLISGSTILSGSTLDEATYEVIVGREGIYTASPASAANNGKNSSFLGFTAIGGGAGGQNTIAGLNGGSGGGGGGFAEPGQPLTIIPGGLGTPGQGFNGGAGKGVGAQPSPPSFFKNPGPGGGAGEAGLDAPDDYTPKRNGASGSQWLDGNFYAGGGGPAGVAGITAGGLGGPGGGGAGGINEFTTGSAGTPNTGGGGGGGGTAPAIPASGGSGVVIIRYEADVQTAVGGDNIFKSGSYWYHQFTNAATSSFSIAIPA